MSPTRDAVMKRRYEAISAGVIVFEPAGTLIYANHQAETILGLSWAEMAGASCIDPNWQSFDADGNVLEPANLPNFLSAVSGQPVHNRVIGLRHCPEQMLRWLLVNASPVVDPQTQAVQEVIVTLNDITALRRKEEALRDSERRLIFALQSIPAGEWELNLQNQSVQFSTRCAEIFLSDAALVPSSSVSQSHYERILDYVVAEDREHVRQVITAAIRERNAFDVEGRIRRADGVKRWLRVSGRPHEINGEIAGLGGILLDITDRKLAEIAKRQTLIQNYETLINEFVDNSNLHYFIVDKDSNYQAFNGHHAKISKLLYGADIVRGKNVLSFVSNPADRSIVEGNIRRALAGEVFTSEHFFGLDGGMCKCLEALHCPIHDENKSIVGVAVFGTDVSERRFAQDSLAASEFRYRKLVEDSKFVLLQLNERGEITFLNQFGCELLECTRAEVTGKRFDELFLPDVISFGMNLKRGFSRLLRHKPAITRRVTVEMLTRSFKRIWVDWSYHWETILYQPGGSLVAAGIDVTRTVRTRLEEQHGYQRRRRQEVLNEAISGNISPLEFAKLALKQGMTISYPLILLLLQPRPRTTEPADERECEENQRRLDGLIDWLHGSGRGIVWRAPDGVGVLLTLPGTDRKEQDAWSQKRAREILWQVMRYLPDFSWNCGVTHSEGKLISLAELYFQAQAASVWGEPFLGSRDIYHWRDFGSYQLVVKEIHSETTARFVNTQLGPLLALGKEDLQKELLDTLRELVTLDPLEKIAQRLHVHRGTVRYRRNALSKLLERDLESGSNLLNLSMAVKIWDALNRCKT